MLRDKSKLYKQYIKNGRKKGDYETILGMTTSITVEISNNKKNHFDNLVERLCAQNLIRLIGVSLNLLAIGKNSNYASSAHKDHFVTNFNEKNNHFSYFFLQINGIW